MPISDDRVGRLYAHICKGASATTPEFFSVILIGLAYEKQGDYARAAELMQILVDFEREIGHPNAEAHAQRVAEVRGKIR